ncbi:hypothetical protein CLIB1423_29S00804 [[Candida] railenensis]|uniref:Endonuclease/exonuclease/phosphatase domain-containing protein n=1 Tax=[Candida] railenensis TaxID=45579 RepID=A0A9P0QW21_9ASCO|nr:hypothetical protein CLIB1423_29S00804 [[Candida] railenensis]
MSSSNQPMEALSTFRDDLITPSVDNSKSSDGKIFNYKKYLKNQNTKSRKAVAFFTSLVLIVGLIMLSKVVHSSLTDNREENGDDKPKSLDLRLYSHNIRYDNRNLERGEHLWSERKHLMTSSVKFHTESSGSSVIGLQEVLHGQLQDILEILNYGNNDWTYYGVGRTDGKESGEYAPILYKKSQWDLIGNRTFWLSETPDVPSIGWDSVLERIVTMVTLRSVVSPSHTINVFCTHFDHIGVVGRRESAKLIMDRMENFNEYPSFLLGDFNTEPKDEPYKILKSHGIKDSRTLATSRESYGHDYTFTGWDINKEANTIIDYIWSPSWSTNSTSIGVSTASGGSPTKYPRTSIQIKNFGVLHSHFGFYMSDHRPVVALYELKH